MAREADRADRLVAAWRRELPDVLGPASELTKRIMFLASDLAEATRHELPRFGLTVAEFDVLATLRRAGRPYRLKPNDLSRSLLLSSGGTSNVVASLARRGLVERDDDPDDRRSAWVRLTDDGVTLAEDAVRATSAAHAQVFAGASDASLEAAATALRELFPAVETGRRRVEPPARAGRGVRAGA